MMSVIAIFWMYGFGMWGWLLVAIILIETLILLLDTANITMKFMEDPDVESRNHYAYVHGAVRLYTDILVIFTTIVAVLNN